MLKSIVYIFKVGLAAIKSDGKSRRIIVLLWVLYLFQYVTVMFTPVINEKLLNGAASLIGGKPDYRSIIYAVAGLIIIGAFAFYKNLSEDYNVLKVSQTIENRINEGILLKLARIKYAYFNSPRVYNDMSAITGAFPDYCSRLVAGRTLPSIIGTAASYVFIFTVLAQVNIWIAVFIILGNVYGIFKTLYEARNDYYLKMSQMPERRKTAAYSAILLDRAYLKEIRLFGTHNYLLAKWEGAIRRLNKRTLRYIGLYSLLDFISSFISNVFTIASLVITSLMILEGKAEIGAFMLVFTSTNAIFDTSGSLFDSFAQLKSASYYGKLYSEFDKLEESEPDIKTLQENYIPLDNIDIKFDKVSFKYDGSESFAVNNLSLNIRQGEKIAIVGENGSGKTTFVSLVNLLYQPMEGRILINGEPLDKSVPNLRRQVVTLMQEYGCYEFLIRDNIEMGDIFNIADEERLRSAARLADIDDFIGSCQRGYDTPIGRLYDEGINLSGGQWQKLAIARTLLRDEARIIILDELNSTLSPIAETQIYNNIFNALRDQTVLMVSHRLGAIKFVDRIIVLKDGSIIEDGTHGELMVKKGVYHEMYTAQSKWYE